MYLQTLIIAGEQDDVFLSNACTERFIHYLVICTLNPQWQNTF